MADLVSVSADPHAVRRLHDATDALHGLAAGLRAVHTYRADMGETGMTWG